jgi:hypothetical protein
MLVPREVLDSVVFVGVETPDGFHTAGVAYFVSVPAPLVPGKAHVYLVTAGHAVRERDNVVARLNAPGGGTTVDLLPQADRWLRLVEPDMGEHHVDLAAVRWNPEVSAGAGYTSTPLTTFFDERLVGNESDAGVGIGDEVVAVALMDVHYAQAQNAPFARTGNVAMIPHEPMLVRFENGPVLRMRLYLIELRSGGGVTGSPVFARPRVPHGAHAPPISLLGTLVGRWYGDDAEQTGLAKVLPAQLLRDLLFQDDETERRREAEQRHLDGDDGWLAPIV